MQKKNSLGMFDLAKGLLMLFVILLHTITIYYKYWDYSASLSFSGLVLVLVKLMTFTVIPAFFMISGYGTRKKTVKKTLKDNSRFIGIPYAITGLVVVIGACIKALIYGENVLNSFLGAFGAFLLGLCPGNTSHFGVDFIGIGPLWFLVGLFFGSLFLSLLLKFEGPLFSYIVCMLVVGFVTRMGFHSFIPYCLVQSLICMTYLFIGRELKVEGLLLRRFTIVEWVLLAGASLCLAIFGNFEVSQNVWRLGAFDYAMSLAIGILAMKLFLEFNTFDNWLTNCLRTIGQRSLDVLCVHSVEYCLIPWEEIFSIEALPVGIRFALILICRGLFVTLGVVVVGLVKKKR